MRKRNEERLTEKKKRWRGDTDVERKRKKERDGEVLRERRRETVRC